MAGRDDVERMALEGAERAGGAAAARDLLRRERVGVLSTLSLRHPGWPYGTLTPYGISARGEPLLLLSALAQHAQNLEADTRASLLVFDAAAAAKDPRTAPRVTLVGRVTRVDAAGEADARERYLDWHGSARGLLQLDFALYTLSVEEAQFVGGFAAAGFFPGAALRDPD
jgi:putative heme iron utilization protein